MGDEAFQIIRSVYAYTPRELKATADEVDDSSPYWRKEKVSFSAAYGDERVPAFVFLPKNAKPPYQALVYHPSAGAQSSTYASMEGFNRMEFIIRSGRAVIYPIYLGTFDRQLPPARSAAEWKDRAGQEIPGHAAVGRVPGEPRRHRRFETRLSGRELGSRARRR